MSYNLLEVFTSLLVETFSYQMVSNKTTNVPISRLPSEEIYVMLGNITIDDEDI